jgi:pyridoxine/pyridoxamine 5'-phosphate oxidase
MSLEDCQRVARAALAAARADSQGKEFAVIVIVKQLDEGSPIDVVTNITSGKATVLDTIKIATDGIRGPLLI